MPSQRFKGLTVLKGLEQDEACQVNVLRVLRF